MSKENEKLKNYILLKTIGKGTFGKVKLAKHIPTDEEVAIKILEKSKINDDDELIRINKEIKYLKLLNHPNIVHLYEIVETQNNYYIIMEYISGGELFNYIVKNKRLSESESSFFFNQIIKGIEEIHKYNICHRDLKPENLLLTSENKILKIIDFGLSNEYSDYLSTPCGSPCYAAPEMIKGRKYNGLSIDIWACGIILFAMVYGFLPFDDKDNEKLFGKILKCNLVFPSNDKIYVSNECKDLIKRIIKLNPNERISLEDIKKHPFLTKKKYNFDFYLYSDNNLIDDNYIIEYMEKNLKIDKVDIQKYIKRNNHNNITTTFKLLKKKFLKEKDYNRMNKFESKNRENLINQKKLLRYTEKYEVDKNKLNITSTSIHSDNNSVKDLNLENKNEKDDLLILNSKLIPSILMKPIYNKLIPSKQNNKNINRKIDTSVSVDKKKDKSKTNSPVKQKSTKSTISTQISNNTNKDINEHKNNIKIIKNKNNKKNENYNGEINVISVNIYNKNKIAKKIDKRTISADIKRHNKRNITPNNRIKTPIKRNDNKISPIKYTKIITTDRHSRDKVLKTENNCNININSNKNNNIFYDLNITINCNKNSEQDSNKKNSKLNKSNFMKNNKIDKNKLKYSFIDNNNKNVNINNSKNLDNKYIPISQREKKQNNMFVNRRETLNNTLKFEKMKISSIRNTAKYNSFDSNKLEKKYSTKNSFEKINNLILNFCKEQNLHYKIIETNKYIIEIEKENKFGIVFNQKNNMNNLEFYILEGNKMKIQHFIKKIIDREFNI